MAWSKQLEDKQFEKRLIVYPRVKEVSSIEDKKCDMCDKLALYRMLVAYNPFKKYDKAYHVCQDHRDHNSLGLVG